MEVSDILDSIDIAEYISQYVELEEKGGELWGLSPFKDEKTPSFSVCPEKKYFYDFSAGFGGNLLDFVMRYHRVNLRDGVGLLKKYANISDQQATGTARMEATKVARRYRRKSRSAVKSTAKILSANYMDYYEFRQDKLKSWAEEGIPWEVLKNNSVRYDAFDDRIVYPIKDYDGNIISVCGRTCDPDFKSKGIRKYTYFQSLGAIDTIYGFSDHKDAILSSREIILFEGAKSCLKAEGWGILNTGALLTSHLSLNQFRFLVRLSSFHGVRVVFALDSDIDILADANIKKLMSYARVEWICNADNLLAPKESPVDQGMEVFQKLYQLRRAMN